MRRIGLSIESYQRECSSEDAANGASMTSIPTGIFPSVNVVDNWPASSTSTTADGRVPAPVGRDVTTLFEPALSDESTRVTSADVSGSSRQTTIIKSASVKYGRFAEQKQQQTSSATVCSR
jgi:hypothetical protein